MFVFPFNSSSRGEQISARRFGIICHRYLYRGSRKRPKKNASTRRVGQSQPLHSRKENKFSLKSSLLRFFSFSTRDSSLYTACNWRVQFLPITMQFQGSNVYSRAIHRKHTFSPLWCFSSIGSVQVSAFPSVEISLEKWKENAEIRLGRLETALVLFFISRAPTQMRA